mmetsp:Transcript_32587/g.28599  ORF Transcript_32587/g.28599 Transcript_32587/m.28599 type:complete len:96 (-) Transcript_32587:44-331(-)
MDIHHITNNKMIHEIIPQIAGIRMASIIFAMEKFDDDPDPDFEGSVFTLFTLLLTLMIIFVGDMDLVVMGMGSMSCNILEQLCGNGMLYDTPDLL